ncbi:hypothetical protein N6L27_13475 [Leisingera sp. SS27]|uniref:hypothetical protein n=1 Tax=Leisingera sp. SS27 TaxID=2979462 RepID=UPI00232DB4FE|nr:hypothetical protein [Leisingera sp. SS27]MDC0659012.1 hypothetical protein [Leisingera sp. SS27]
MKMTHTPASRRNSPARHAEDMKNVRGICYKNLLLHSPLTLEGTSVPLFDVCQINQIFLTNIIRSEKHAKDPFFQPFSNRRKAKAITPAMAM